MNFIKVADLQSVLSLILSYHLLPYLTLCSIPVPHLHPPLLFFSVFLSSPTGSPGSEDSPLGSPCVVVNGNGSVNGQGMGGTSVLGPCQSPEGRQLSPLTSPLLTDAGYVRNEDEEEARRKVGVQSGITDADLIYFSNFLNQVTTHTSIFHCFSRAYKVTHMSILFT